MGNKVILYDAGGSSMIEGLGIVGSDTKSSARLIGAPIETGQITFDNKVIEPRTVSLKCLIRSKNYDSVRSKVDEMLANRQAKFYSVLLKDGGKRENLALESASFPDNPDKLDVIEYSLSFKEIIIQGRLYKTKNASDQATT